MLGASVCGPPGLSSTAPCEDSHLTFNWQRPAQLQHAVCGVPAAHAEPAAPPRCPRPQVADLIGAGKVKVEVALSLPLEEFGKAHAQVATGHTRGKVVLTV